ncbi:hypothetical protein QFZ63_002882 [Streptomyces sp. B3I7]|nr:hypothetical protein [Streptomyces sp. B3I7]
MPVCQQLTASPKTGGWGRLFRGVREGHAAVSICGSAAWARSFGGPGAKPPAGSGREAAAGAGEPAQDPDTTPLASPAAVPSVALAGTARPPFSAAHTCAALASSTSTRFPFAGSYRTGMVTMCIF